MKNCKSCNRTINDDVKGSKCPDCKAVYMREYRTRQEYKDYIIANANNEKKRKDAHYAANKADYIERSKNRKSVKDFYGFMGLSYQESTAEYTDDKKDAEEKN